MTDPATWSPMQRRAWAIEQAVALEAAKCTGTFTEVVHDLERFLAEAALVAITTPGLTIRQDPFGNT